MMTDSLEPYEKVIVSDLFDSTDAAGKEAAVIGISKCADGTADYAVIVLETDECFLVPARFLTPTGESVDKSYLYPGSTDEIASFPKENYVLIHLFIEARNQKDAEVTGKNLARQLGEFGDISLSGLKKYWKIPEYFECSIEVRKTSLLEEDCQKIARSLGSGWIESGGSLIWNSGERARFSDHRVKWANLEFIEST